MTLIGGMFGLETGTRGTRSPFEGRGLHLANARSAIALVARETRPRMTWLPSYVCKAVPGALSAVGAPFEWYPVGGDLRVRELGWLSRVEPGDLVVLVDYFGWPMDRDCAREVRRRGARVLEDGAHALLSSHVLGPEADFAVLSPRKHLGVPDGGILLAKEGALDLSRIGLEEAPARLRQRALAACAGRRAFDERGGDRDWFRLFREVEAEQPIGSFAASELARTTLGSGFDWESARRRRLENHGTLAALLGSLALFPELPEGTVPLGFPVRHRSRDRIRDRLYSEEIYPPVHWPLAGFVPGTFRESHELAGEILTLPCDQRYGREHMERIARLVLDEARR